MVSPFEQQLFLAINEAHSDFLDGMMILVSGKYTWVPLYLLLLFYIWKYYKNRVIEIFIYIAVIIGLSDQSSVLIKNYFERLRPCHEDSLQSVIHLADGCGGKFGFVSSHAANSMALTVFILLLFASVSNKYRWLILIYTFIIGYSRIYLGAHYPSDVLGGYCLGALIAIVFYYTLKSRFILAPIK
jgi:undecaprenyl-diphosphatase